MAPKKPFLVCFMFDINVLFCLIVVFHSVIAVVAPLPKVTPAALLPREDITTFAWYATTDDDGSTTWSPLEYDQDAISFTTSDTYFAPCEISSECVLYTGCESGYMLAADVEPTYCGDGSESDSSWFCSDHVWYATYGAETPWRWYWCDLPPVTGSVFYGEEPTTPASAIVTVTSFAPTMGVTPQVVTVEKTVAPTQTAPPLPSKQTKSSKSNTGAIAGGAVGGVAGLAIIGAAIFFWRRRRKQNAGPEKPDEILEEPGFQRYSRMPPGGFEPIQQTSPAEAPGDTVPYAPEKGAYFPPGAIADGKKGTEKYAHEAEQDGIFGGELQGSEPQPQALERSGTIKGGELPAATTPPAKDSSPTRDSPLSRD